MAKHERIFALWQTRANATCTPAFLSTNWCFLFYRYIQKTKNAAEPGRLLGSAQPASEKIVCSVTVQARHVWHLRHSSSFEKLINSRADYLQNVAAPQRDFFFLKEWLAARTITLQQRSHFFVATLRAEICLFVRFKYYRSFGNKHYNSAEVLIFNTVIVYRKFRNAQIFAYAYFFRYIKIQRWKGQLQSRRSNTTFKVESYLGAKLPKPFVCPSLVYVSWYVTAYSYTTHPTDRQTKRQTSRRIDGRFVIHSVKMNFFRPNS